MSNEQSTLLSENPEEANNMLNQLFQEPKAKADRRWYRTPEICDDPSRLNPVERRIHDEITELREKEKLDTRVDDEQRKAFLANFQWENSILTDHERQQLRTSK